MIRMIIRPGITSPLAELDGDGRFWGWAKSHAVSGWWLDLPLWKMMEFKSVGMMTFSTEWKNKKNVPNHQPGLIDVRSSHLQNNCEEATAVKLPEGVIHLDQNPSILFDVFQHLRGQTMVEPPMKSWHLSERALAIYGSDMNSVQFRFALAFKTSRNSTTLGLTTKVSPANTLVRMPPKKKTVHYVYIYIQNQ